MADHYIVDSKASRFQVRITASGPLSAFGHNPTIAIPDFEGDIHADFEKPQNSSLRLKVKAGSLFVATEVSDKDQREIEKEMQEKVLEVSKFPEIVYESKSINLSEAGDKQYRAEISGQLNLHGTEKTQAVKVQVQTSNNVLHGHGEFSLRQSDYNINPVTAAAGMIKVQDMLKFSFDIVARKQG